MNEYPYMQLYVSDYLADTAHLTATEHGAYLLLLMNQWQRGEPMPGEDKRLAMIARTTQDEWAEIKESVLAFFDRLEDGRVTHRRIERDLVAARAKSDQAKAAVGSRRDRVLKVDDTPSENSTNEQSTDDLRTYNGRTTEEERPLYDSESESESYSDKENKDIPASRELPTRTKQKRIKPEKRQYGSHKNVLLTDAEHERLLAEYKADAPDLIQFFSDRKKMKGYKYQDDNLAIRDWGIRAYFERKRAPPGAVASQAGAWEGLKTADEFLSEGEAM